MNQLVFKSNDQVVTSSRNIARDFNKSHRDVLRAIDDIFRNGVAQNCADLFYESTYIHEQNKQEYRQYLMNRDGFTLLVMGFTGKTAMKFKLDYINAFNEMEKELAKPVNSTKLLLETALKHEEKIESIESDVKYLKNTMRIDSGQEYRLNQKAKQIVIEALGGIKSPAYKQLGRKAFSEFWRDFKKHFTLTRYGDLPKKQFEDALRFIGMWQPSTSLRIEIDNANNQQVMSVV